ncbi:MAG: peptidase M16, partial [Deltaproteobacteria bacterium]|nr:peptidase M16 [Deltaproteobacteria bacterium]
MQAALVRREGLLLNLTVDEKEYPGVEPTLHELIEGMPDGAAPAMAWSFAPPDEFEAMSVPSQVNYVGKGANIYAMGYRFHGSVNVITRYVRNTWLWDRVRVQGGAYGAYCLFDRHTGVLTFLSYRDPHIMKTVTAFDDTARFLRDLDIGDGELTKGIIGTIGDMDAALFPDARGYASMIRHLVGTTEEERQQVRDEVLSTKASDFRAFADICTGVGERGLVKMLGSESAIREALQETSLPFKVMTVL